MSTDISRRGALQLTGAVAGGLVLAGAFPAAAGGKQRMYVGSYTGSGGPGVGVGRIDAATGALEVDSWLQGPTNPSWVALSPDRRTLWAVSESVPGGLIATFRPGSADRPGPADGVPTGSGPVHLSVHPSGRYLFASMYDGGEIAVHPVGPDGGVGPATETVRPSTSGQSRIHQTIVDPSERWLLSADLGRDRVLVHRLDDNGRLHAAGEARLPAGAAPRHLAFHPQGRHAYSANEGDSTVTVFRWDNGRLTAPRSFPTLLGRPAVRNHPGGLAVSPDGRHLYVSNRGDNSIAVFAVEDDGARLRLVATPSCGGDWPRHLAIDTSGRWLCVANQRSDEVVCFALDRETGTPVREAGRLAVPAVAQVLLA
ncbi:lactonase family protein [Kitasatospora sp. NPDC085879]|uniref:lactonase family protein n=1 Tax=Kitasatospora sp. NPDC085879 TaxID=3154769 RepID=UPI00343E019D